MANPDLLTKLYQRMSAEQEQYRKWLLGQPPGEILNHAAEYTVREDIVMEMGRGIHPVVLDYCLEHKLLFETKQYHNALFAEYGREGKMRYAALRGTLGDFKGEVTGSDKHYSFSISAPQESGRLHLFESAIDLLSYATLTLGRGWDWQKDSLLSLAGVYQTKRKNVVPIALSRYLQEHPNIHTLQLHLDNDEVGRGAAAGIMGGLHDRYKVLDQPPTSGKDVNELLQRKLGLVQRKEEWSR